MRSDPGLAPVRVEWLSATEDERLEAVRAGSPRRHAVIHVAGPRCHGRDESLLADGLDRHEALHAIGSVLAGESFEMLKLKRSHDPDRYVPGLQRLTAEAWRRGGDA